MADANDETDRLKAEIDRLWAENELLRADADGAAEEFAEIFEMLGVRRLDSRLTYAAAFCRWVIGSHLATRKETPS